MPQNDNEFQSWTQLRAEPAEAAVLRLKRRLRLVRFGKDMVTHNAWAFWVVLNAFLKLLFLRSTGSSANRTDGG